MQVDEIWCDWGAAPPASGLPTQRTDQSQPFGRQADRAADPPFWLRRFCIQDFGHWLKNSSKCDGSSFDQDCLDRDDEMWHTLGVDDYKTTNTLDISPNRGKV